VAGELRQVFREMCQLSYEISKAQRARAALDYKALGDMIHRIIGRIDCDYETATYPSGYVVTRLKGIWVRPRLGSPEYRTILPDGTHLCSVWAMTVRRLFSAYITADAKPPGRPR
jgi:hypothetical protein